MSQTSNWHNIADTIEYTYAKVGINTTAPKEALEIKEGFMRGSSYYGALRIRTDHGITAVGADSPGYSHFDTDRDRFFFYKPIMIQGGCISSSHNTDLRLQTFFFNGTSINPTTRLTILNSNGYVGIGTTTPANKLDVNGTIRSNALKTGNVTAAKITAEEVLVTTSNSADFVFDENYNLRTLDEVQSYIQQNKHLPEIPSAQYMQENGISINEFQIQLLQKIEELTLYIIKQDERIKELEAKK